MPPPTLLLPLLVFPSTQLAGRGVDDEEEEEEEVDGVECASSDVTCMEWEWVCEGATDVRCGVIPPAVTVPDVSPCGPNGDGAVCSGSDTGLSDPPPTPPPTPAPVAALPTPAAPAVPNADA